MTDAKRTAEKLEEVLRVLSGLKGVRQVFYLDKDVRSELRKTETEYESRGPLPVANEGVLECLKRKHVACIVKDKTFRAPPHATVLLIDDKGKVIGKELLPGEKIKTAPGVKTLALGKDFVIFYDGKTSGQARFVLPPVPFEEVEQMEGVREACSSSPSTMGDILIKRSKGLDDDPKLATILIGFDLQH